MKLKCSFEIVNLDNEYIAIPVGEGAKQIHGVLKLNKEGSIILEKLKNDTSLPEILRFLTSEYENKPVDLEKYIQSFVSELRSLGLLED